MKWLTFISCLFLLCFTESKYLSRASRDAELPDTIKTAFELTGEHFDEISVVLVSQFLQQSTYDEVHKVVEDMDALAKKCTADEHSDAECAKSVSTVLLDEICHEEAIAAKHGFGACCAQTDPERHECFLTHKNASKGFVPPYQKPEPEEACKQFHDNKKEVLNHYLYEISRRSPYIKIVTILHAEDEYEKVLTACCEAEDKAACFMEKAPLAKKKFMKAVAVEKHHCSILKKFKMDTLRGYKIAHMCQKFPKADFQTIMDLSEKVGHIYEECCRGDTLDCMLDRKKLADHICSHQDTISSKLKHCCEGPILERGECIAHAENDEKPADLSPTVREFIDDEAVCQHYAENKGVHLAKFLCEYSRRHDELAPVMLLRLAKGYEEMLEKCCATEHPVTCLQEGETLLKKYIADSLATVKANCDQYKQIGSHLFGNELIVRYGRKAPQLSTDQLRMFSKKMVGVAEECCHLDDAHRLACAENHVDLGLGYLCHLHEEHPINKQVCKCCSDSFTKRRECFAGLGVDPDYVPIPFNTELVHFHADYCTAKPEEQQEKKQTVLAHMMQHKPDITDEQLATTIVDFTGVVTNCCSVETKEECFNTEIPKMIERIKTALGEH
uniref:Alpha-fetoprotein-like n=1 Tax=Pogona vitticeps TaxID=103695 RepID=A0A6J0V7Y0_9SAUR